jgi:hypothetical protein
MVFAVNTARRGRRTLHWGKGWRLASALILLVTSFSVALSPATALAASGPVTVSVPATNWLYTGVNLSAGEVLHITAAGSWTDGATTSGPDGAVKLWPDNFFNLADLGACNYCAKTATSQWGALIGYIGASPPVPGSYTSAAIRPQALRVFYVGGNYEAQALQSGKLWLFKNADAYSNYTSDNHGHVIARITVLPPESASQVEEQGRVAALSTNALTPLQQAANFCGRAILDAASSAAVTAALEKLLDADGVNGVFYGATIIGDSINVDYELSDGQIGNATFDIGRVVFTILGEIPGFELFGIVGDPAIDCTEAGFWLDGQLGGQLGQFLRHKLWPPSTAAAGIAGTWTLTRAVLTCVNFSEGCHTTPIHIRFSHCTQSKCVISRTDGGWKNSHTIELIGRTWTAHFSDLSITCGTQVNNSNITIRLSVTSSYRHNGIELARTLGGTYANSATTNPPNCTGNASALENLHGSRSLPPTPKAAHSI